MRKVGQRQYAVIMYSRKDGERIAKEHPEIVREYRAGATLEELAERHSEEYDIESYYPKQSFQYALFLLLKKKERARIAKKHIVNALDDMPRGFGTLTEKERKKLAKRAGSISGKKHKKEGLGIFGLTQKERKKYSEVGIMARGDVPYTGKLRKTDYGKTDERKYVIMLKEKTDLTWQEIGEKVNEVYRNDRYYKNIRSSYSSWKKLIARASARA